MNSTFEKNLLHFGTSAIRAIQMPFIIPVNKNPSQFSLGHRLLIHHN
jgi:hypothetical protein